MAKVTITCKCETKNPSKYDAETLFCYNCGRDLKPALDRLHTILFLAMEDPEELKRLQERSRKTRDT